MVPAASTTTPRGGSGIGPWFVCTTATSPLPCESEVSSRVTWQLRGPAAKENRAAADAVGETGKAARYVGTPGQPPNLGARYSRVNGGWPWRRQTQVGQVLYVLGEKEGPRLQDQDSVVGELIGV